LDIPTDVLRQVDIALMNLLCAERLPGAENLNTSGILAKLDNWAIRVKRETDRHLYRVHHPKFAKLYAHSEARLRMEMIVGVLQQDFGVRYNPDRMLAPSQSDSRDLFIHGMLGNGDGGTCISMPVLYVAIGRRLGYPMYLSFARQHVFCRWDGWGERWNMDGSTSSGIGFPEDDFYCSWPKILTDDDLETGAYLTPLSPPNELALFLHTRGFCLIANNRITEALQAFEQAAKLAPHIPYMQQHHKDTEALLLRIRINEADRRVRRLVEQELGLPINSGFPHPRERTQRP
jgi:hypothetical protein